MIRFTILFILINLYGIGFSQQWSVEGENIPYGMSPVEWQRLQQSVKGPVFNTSRSHLNNSTIFANGGFETGDFSGWIIQDLAVPFMLSKTGICRIRRGRSLLLAVLPQ